VGLYQQFRSAAASHTKIRAAGVEHRCLLIEVVGGIHGGDF
jgi:hypothetical protein